MQKNKVTDEIRYLSARHDYISYFYRDDSCNLYVFNLSLEKMQRLHRTKLRVFILNTGDIYTTIPEAKLISRSIKYNIPLNKKPWGYEQSLCKDEKFKHIHKNV